MKRMLNLKNHKNVFIENGCGRFNTLENFLRPNHKILCSYLRRPLITKNRKYAVLYAHNLLTIYKRIDTVWVKFFDKKFEDVTR